MLIYSVEDDEDISLIINKTLTKQGFTVKSFENGKKFLEQFKLETPDIVLLDLMLPDMSGSDIIKKIRSNQKYDNVHIIVVSAKHMTMDKVENLDLGADDYIEKPFDLLELMSRVEAHARRLRKSNLIKIGDIELDVAKRECIYQNKPVDLTVKEFDILLLLAKNAPNVLSRDQLFEEIWNTNQIVESRSLDMHIKTLRSKLNDDGKLIKSIYGIGYKLNI
ncbi:two component transcriptional regulator winged helix family [Firmicutes bacterium CAG:313]|jgi:phosphate regulon response regulator phoB|nr:two component transcriptional regulator winged helix family [Firmicutes bacterium CAG:313]